MPPKKAKGKAGTKSKDKGPVIPPEWQAKSVEELRLLVAELQSELEAARKRRNKAQVEHASLQSYYDVTKQQIQELDMRIEKIDLEIENAEEDNATELQVYKQKSNFIQYCHEKKVEATAEEDVLKQQTSKADQERLMSELEASKTRMLSDLNELERRQAEEIKKLQAEIDHELSDVKQQLDLDILRFHEDCDRQHAQLKEELESRRRAELDIVTSRKESHLNDLMQSHEKTCAETREYFEGIEREQQIEIEELEAEIRKLKKAAVHHAATKERLEASNLDSGKELSVCLEQVANLEIKTKDLDKDGVSLQNTNARIGVTKRLIREAKLNFAKLQDEYSRLQIDRDLLRDHTSLAAVEACKSSTAKKTMLENKMQNQKQTNSTIERHLHHIINSAGLDERKSNILLNNLEEFIEDNAKDTERLQLVIANAKKSYRNILESKQETLRRLGVPEEEVLLIDVLLEKGVVP